MSIQDSFDSQSNPDMEFKVVLIGDGFVGKTSLVNRFYSDYFSSNEPPTIAASYLPISMEINNKKICLNLWDTAGHEKFHCLVPLYARNADALIVVFDLSNLETYNGAKEWYTNTIEDIGRVPVCVLCANKLDLFQNNDFSDFETWSKENNCLFYKTSALNGENVHEMFESIAQKLVSFELKKQVKNNLNHSNKEKSGCRC